MRTVAPLIALAFFTSPLLSRPKTNDAAVSILGQPNFTSEANSNPPTNRSLWRADGLAIDPITGKLFISEKGNHRILRFSSVAAYQTFAEAEAVLGQPDFNSNQPNRGTGASSLTLSTPANLCFDASGNLWAADSGNARVLRYDDASSKPQFGGAADAVIGQPDFFTTTTATNSTSDSGFVEPIGVAVDSEDNLYVLENGNVPRILRFANASSSSGDVVASSYLGKINGSNAFVPGLDAGSFSLTPYGICVDANDRLWVADASNHRVLRFDDPKVTGATADGVIGQADFVTNAIADPPTAASLNVPLNVCVAPDGTLWVSDYVNHRVLGFLDAANKADGADAEIVLGQSDFVTNTAKPYSATTTGNPTQIAIGREGSLFIGEDGFGAHVKRWSDPVTITAPKKVSTGGTSAVLQGTSSGAVSVAYKVAGQGGFKAASGTVANWLARAKRLRRKITPVTVRATAFDNRTATAVVRVAKRK